MSTEYVVAIISATAAIVGAFIAVFNSFFSTKQAARTQKELERLKIVDRQLEENRQALQQGVEALQLIRDALQTILDPIEESLTISDALREIEEARNHVVKVYRNTVSILNTCEARAFHKSKSIAVGIEKDLKYNLKKHEYVSMLSEEVKVRFARAHAALHELQQTLSERKFECESNRIRTWHKAS